MSSNVDLKKVLIGAAAVTLVGVGGYLLYKRLNEEEDSDEEEELEKKPKNSKQEIDEESPEKLEEALKYKELGNQAFKQGDFEKAIENYGKSLELSKKDGHFVYSNRSAAYLKVDAEKALEDAKMCIKLSPDWAKGYFRLGKALLHLKRPEEAFAEFYRGLKKDPENAELKKVLEETKAELALTADMDTRSKVESKVIRLYFEDQSVKLCQNKFSSIPLTYKEFDEIVSQAVKAQNLDLISDSAKFKQALQTAPSEALRIVVHLLSDVHAMPTEAEKYARQAVQENSNDDQALLLLVWCILRSKSTKNLFEALSFIRKAAQLNPSDAVVFHIFSSIVVRTHAEIPFSEVVPLLKELQIGLNNPNTVKLMLIDAGLSVWLRFFQDPKMQSILMAEEEDNARRGVPMNEAAIKGLVRGGFARIVRQPFFVQSLTQVVVTNYLLEKVLCPFRAALLTLQPGETFDELASFVHALSMQCALSNYSWSFISEEEFNSYRTLLNTVTTAIEKNKNDLAALATDRTFFVQLSQLALYQDLGELEHLYEVVKAMKLEQMDQYWRLLIQHQVLAAHREEEIRDSLTSKSLVATPIQQQNPIVKFYNQHPSPTWVPANIAKSIKQVTIATELEWLFPSFDTSSFNGVNKVFVAGCGSGLETVQMAVTYENIEVTGMDVSEVQIAYAIRSAEDMGISNVKFLLGDITALSQATVPPGQFDVILATSILHHLPDPLKAWKELTSILRVGGIMRVGLRPKRFVDMIAQVRNFLTGKFQPSIFNDRDLVPGTNLPKVLRAPTREEARQARNMLGEIQEQQSFMEDLVQNPQFYTLNEFYDMVFDPCLTGFTFTQIADYLQKLNLKLIGFEFPVQQDTMIKYRAEFPDDPQMLNAKYLDQFEEQNPGQLKVQTHHIAFTCQKL